MARCLHEIDLDSDCYKCNQLLSQLDECKYCGDLCPYHQMAEHQTWCIPMIVIGESEH